jgi:glycosyltransferase involved in cell wall biosynthesis
VNILALVDSADHVCYRYRLKAFQPAFQAQGWSLACHPVGRGALWPGRDVLERADVIVLQRRLVPLWTLRRLTAVPARLVYDVDDAVFLRDSYAGRSQHSARRLRRFRAVVSRSDSVWVGNCFLAAHAARFCPTQRVAVVPTCVDPLRYRSAEHHRRRAGVELVWIGSRSTVQSFDRARPLLEELGERVPGLRLRVICDQFPQLENLEVIRRPWSQETEAAELAQADIGISWLPDDLWSRGKCGLKVLQYMAACLPVLVNPVGVQAAMVRHGETGYHATTTKQWVGAVAELAENSDLRRAMGNRGRREVEERYSVQRWAPRVVETLRRAVQVANLVNA